MTNNRPLRGKRALVFGGSRGIGAAIARRLAEGGADVALTYVSAADQAAELAAAIEATGRTALVLRADSADPAAPRLAAEAAAAQFGGLDIAVINAGVLVMGALDAVAPRELDRSVDINVRGVFLAIQAVQRHMGEGGRIITIGSNAANRAAPASSVYGMTKAAVASLVRSAALDLAPRGITVNNIQPGPIQTDMTEAVMDDVLPRIPLGRIGQPEEVAALVAYVVSVEAAYMTGASLTIDGGMSL